MVRNNNSYCFLSYNNMHCSSIPLSVCFVLFPHMAYLGPFCYGTNKLYLFVSVLSLSLLFIYLLEIVVIGIIL